MNKTKFLFATIALSLAVLALVNVNSAFAQEPTEKENIQPWHYALAGASFLVSGVFYSSSGWIKKIRRNLTGQAGDALDYKKFGKSLAIGVILGIGAMIASTINGDTIVILNAEQFFVQVSLNTTVILFVDKWILGRASAVAEKKSSPLDNPEWKELDQHSAKKAAPTGDADDDDFESLEDEIPTTIPPGKDA